ncbi:Uncharacterized protein PECH_006337 [Penicillium ucsense]|uniref:NB-ARC domain-containing protein n=1 Tax=Penicillium ucsense TaxID=2839758 RepID=A0A8J8W8A6_9EURO|nr:Uncharacterized protein PECM_001468 [Penicillium ucsense]KAF7739130.1 Uncharacterized protein PECH_006337 [Penicillium ucsense]
MTSLSIEGNHNSGLLVGANSGTIYFTHSAKRPETPPNPLTTVPFERDPDFVYRSTLLQSIHEKISTPGSRIALVGLGGVGKSQLAIEYSYQIRSESPEIWVIWVYASNEARFEESFRDIAERLKIPSRQDPDSNIFQLVENWLLDEKKGTWICILDNADDDKFLCSPLAAGKGSLTKQPLNASTKPLLEYIPRCRNGSLIITSRSRKAALRMVKEKDVIDVNPMAKSEALELLQKTLDQPEESQESQQNQGRWEEAEQLNVQVMETFNTKLGVDHPDTLTSMGNLALTYMDQGRWEEAEQLEVQVIETLKTKLGVDYLHTLTSIGFLASTYRN